MAKADLAADGLSECVSGYINFKNISNSYINSYV